MGKRGRHHSIFGGIASICLILFILVLPALSYGQVAASLAESQDVFGYQKASGTLRAGPLEVHPYVSLQEKYTDNVFYTPTGKDHDFITSFIPGLLLQLPVRDHTITLDANTTLMRYARFSSENTTDYNISGAANLELGSLMNLKLSDTETKGHEPRSSSSTGFIEKYLSNIAAASFTYRLADVSKVQLDYSRTAWNFRTSTFRSRDEDLLSASLYYRVMPKTSVFLEGDYKNVSFHDKSNELDNKVYAALMGVTWQITEKSNGIIKAGYLWKDFDVQSQGKVNTWTGSMTVNHEFADYSTIKIVGTRDVHEASVLDTRYYITTGVYGEITQRIFSKFAALAKASYGEDKYSDVAPGEAVLRKDKTTYAGAGIRYYFRKWLELVLEYNYMNRNSNIDTHSYTENSVIFTINASL